MTGITLDELSAVGKDLTMWAVIVDSICSRGVEFGLSDEGRWWVQELSIAAINSLVSRVVQHRTGASVATPVDKGLLDRGGGDLSGGEVFASLSNIFRRDRGRQVSSNRVERRAVQQWEEFGRRDAWGDVVDA